MPFSVTRGTKRDILRRVLPEEPKTRPFIIALLAALATSPAQALTPALQDGEPAPAAAPARTLTPQEAALHVGQTARVCGVVASAHFAARSGTTFLNLGAPYPHQPFTAVIFQDARAQFGTPERTLLGQHICVRGEIKDWRTQIEIVLETPAQLER